MDEISHSPCDRFDGDGAGQKTADGLTNPGYIEYRMKQGFTVFVMQSFDDAFKAVDIGRKASGRPATNN